jgi:hypothetical protein
VTLNDFVSDASAAGIEEHASQLTAAQSEKAIGRMLLACVFMLFASIYLLYFS